MPYADIGREVGAREAAYWDKPEEAAQKAGVTKDLLLALAAQKALSTQQAAQRNTDMGMQIPAGSIVEQNMQLLQQRDPRAVAQNTGGVAQQQAQQMQDRMRQLAGSGIAGAAPAGMAANAPRGGIADAVRPTPHRMAEGGVVPPPQQNLTGPTPSLSSDAANFLNMYKQFQRAMQNPQLRPEEKAKLERNFQMSTQNFSTDTKAEAFNYLDTESGLGAELKMRCGGMVNKYNRGGVVAFQRGGDVMSGSEIDEAIRREGITDPQLVALIKQIYQQESSGGRDVRTSPDGARGPMQVTDVAFRDVNRGDLDPSKREDRVLAGVRYARQGWEATGGDPYMTAAYYHGGPQAPSRIQRTGRGLEDSLGMNTADYAEEVAGRVPQETTTQRPASRPLQPMMPESGIASAAPRNMALQPISERPTRAAPAGELSQKDRLRNYASGLVDTASEYLSTLPEKAPGIAQAAGDKIRDWGAGYAERMPSMQELAEGRGLTPRRVGSAMREFVTAPFLGAVESAEDFGRGLIGLPERQVQPPPAATQAQPQTPARQMAGFNQELDTTDPQTMVAQALKDKLGGGRPAAQAPQAPQATGIAQAALNDRIAQMTDPRRAKMQDLAAMLAGAGGYRNMGNMGKGMVAAGMESQKRREDSLDAMLNDQLNRESQESIYAGRNAADLEQAKLRALAENLKARDPEAYLKKGDEFDERYRELVMGQIEEELAKKSGDRNISTPEFRAEVERRYQIEREKYIVNSMNSAYSAMNTVENPRSQTQAAADAILGI